MRSTFHGLELGKSALYAQQKALTTTGQNIANANTKGYTRQQVNFQALTPLDMRVGNAEGSISQLGTGVKVDSISRARDAFTDQQFRNESSNLGKWTSLETALTQAEMAFQEPSESGLQAVTNHFWNSWHDLSTEPSNMAIRQVVVQAAEEMVSTAKHIKLSLTSLRDNVQGQQRSLTDKANEFLEGISSLNIEIAKIGDGANDLKDERDVLVDQLSKIIDVKVEQQSNGDYLLKHPSNGAVIDKLNNDNLIELKSGSLYGSLKAEEVINDKIEKLDLYMKTFVFGDAGTGNKGVNELHREGYTLREDNGNPVSDIPLFNGVSKEDFSIEQLKVNNLISSDVGYLAASSEVDSEGKVIRGNGEIALEIGKLREQNFAFGSNDSMTLDDFFSQTMTGLGIDTKEAKSKVETFTSVTLAIDERRQSISGVSLDEEMANLVKFQHAYNAAARVVSTVDEMLETVIHRLRAR